MSTLYKLGLALPAALLLWQPAYGIKALPAHEAVEYPEAVLITATAADGWHACAHTGVLIAPNVVLTAAHYVKGFQTFDVFAPYAQGSGTHRMVTKEAHVHPRFQPGSVEDDLAVLRLKEPLD